MAYIAKTPAAAGVFFAFNCPFRDKHNTTQCELDMAFHSGHSRSVKQKKYSMYFCLTGGTKAYNYNEISIFIYPK